MNRQEHLDWCKQRALEYLNRNEPMKAWTSFGSDMNKHDETRDHMDLFVGMEMLINGRLGTCEDVRKFIDAVK